MTIDIAYYQAKVYPEPPCWALVADLYTCELNLPVTLFKTVNASVRQIATAFTLALRKNPDGFQQIAEPVEHCVVLLGSSRSRRIGFHHCGIYLGDSVLHALSSGTIYQDLASLGDAYPLMEFWARADA